MTDELKEELTEESTTDDSLLDDFDVGIEAESPAPEENNGEADVEEPEEESAGDGEDTASESEEGDEGGTLRQSDYTRKTAELARERESLHAEVERERTAINDEKRQMREEYSRHLEQLVNELRSLDPTERIIEQIRAAHEIGDTEEVNRLRLDLRDAQEYRQRREAQLERIRQDELSEKGKSDAASLESQRKLLLEKLPFLKDASKHDSFQKTMGVALEKAGYSKEEAAKLAPDARQAVIAYYAGLYLKGREKSPAVAEAIKGKVVTPKTASRINGKTTKQADALQRFSPNDERSLARLFEAYDF